MIWFWVWNAEEEGDLQLPLQPFDLMDQGREMVFFCFVIESLQIGVCFLLFAGTLCQLVADEPFHVAEDSFFPKASR